MYDANAPPAAALPEAQAGGAAGAPDLATPRAPATQATGFSARREVAL